MTIPQRRGGYACDITYCTNKQVAFDYLRDRLTLGNRRDRVRLALEPAYASDSRMKKLLLRGLCFAIVDEADSVLVDEARTPLILTQNVDSAMAHSAYRSALRLAEKLKPGDDFVFDPVHHTAALTLAGQQKLAAMRLPGEGLWQNSRWREELVSRALHAVYRLERDRDYLVHNNKVWIIDANTGRTLPDHCWENGLHQMVEAKEKCPLTPAREQLGRLTYQRFFRRYLLLSGMTGTAREVAAELQSIYGLRVRRIPLHRPCRRIRVADRVFWRAQEKWSAVIAAVKQTQAQGRPVLIGTGSVADSELLSRQLRAAGIAHRVLNARQNQQEAAIVAAAGQEGQVTVATNMAGRGTDIPLGRGVAERGGLHVIATCFNDARRIDRQLAGRCARQGDPGSHQTIVSLEDEIFRDNGRPWMLRLLNNNWLKNIFFIDILNRWVIRDAQRRIERRHREARQALLRDERQTGRLLAFSGPLE
jgi:preprotein translocase subunit SecA